MNEIKQLTEEFIKNVTHVVEVGIRQTVLSALGSGKGYDYSKAPAGLPKSTSRRKGPVQLCLIPGCRAPAAPVFHMLCAKHKDTPKRLVAKYRAARKAKKAGK